MTAELLANLNRIHTTELGAQRIRKNLGLDPEEVRDVVAWCVRRIEEAQSVYRQGKNWYVCGEGFVMTVNANSYTIITAHKQRKA